MKFMFSRQLSNEECDAVRRAFGQYRFDLNFVEVPEVAKECLIYRDEKTLEMTRTVERPVPGLAVRLRIDPK